MSRRAPPRTAALIGASALLLVQTGCGGSGGDAEKEFAFGRCPSAVDLDQPGLDAKRLARVEITCATLRVPLDHGEADGKAIEIAVVRARSVHGKPSQGSLVLNPGGPGQSGLDYLPRWATAVSDTLLDNFDLISFDPRGTGLSAPINCGPLPDDDTLGPFPDLLSNDGYAAAAGFFERLSASCSKALGKSAAYFNTGATAEDLDLLLHALGEKKLTYVGFSYGAKLGAEYARRHPDHVRALVLDAPSDPAEDAISVHEIQVGGFEAAFDQFAQDCARRPSCAALGEMHTVVGDLMEQANAHPIPSKRPGDDLPANGSTVLDGTLAMLYDDATWPALEAALREALGGDSGSLFEAAESFDSGAGHEDLDVVNVEDASYVINCNDQSPGPTDVAIKSAAAQFTDEFPLWGAWGSFALFGCSRWSEERTPLETPYAPSAPPILVIGGLHDPATPYAGAVGMTEVLGGSARLLTWEGQGHTAYLRSECIDRRVDDYLINLVLPREGARCVS